MGSSDEENGGGIQRAQIIDPGDLVARANENYASSQDALSRQQAFIEALAAQNGLGNQSSVFNQQQALANQIQGVADGTGPNLAMAQLNQNTGNNIASQAALMAGQRGASSNVGLLARQAGMQGGNLQQQAVGQGAILQAQQQMNAMQALAQQQANMQGVAGNQIGQQAGALNAYNQASQGLYNQNLGGIANQNNAINGVQSSLNSANAGIAASENTMKGQIIGGTIGAVGAIAAGGGGGLGGGGKGTTTAAADDGNGLPTLGHAHGGLIQQGRAPVKGDSPANDTVPAMLSPKEIVIPRSITMGANAPAEAAKFVAQELAKHHTGVAKHYAEGGLVDSEWGDMTPGEDASAMAAGAPETPFMMQDPSADVPVEAAAPPGVMMAPPAAAPAPSVPQPASVSGSWEESAPQVATGPTPASVPQAAAAGAQAGGQYANTVKALQQGRNAYMQEANAVGALGKQQADVYGKLEKDMVSLEQTQAQERAKYKAAIEETVKATANNEIDPNRFVGSMSTPQRVMSAIGLIMGGIGGAMTGQENPALKYLNKLIDQDIDAQKANMSNKNNLINHYRMMGSDASEADSKAKATMLSLAKLKVDQATALAQGDIAKARGMQASTELGKQIGMLEDQAVASKTAAVVKNDPRIPLEQKIGKFVPQKDQDNARKEVSAVNAYKASTQEIQNIYAEAKKLSAGISKLPLTDQKAKLEILNAGLNRTIRAGAKGMGAFTDADERALVAPYQISQADLLDHSKLDIKKKGLISGMGEKVSGGTPTLKQYGLAMDTQAAAASGDDQRLLNWAKANARDPAKAAQAQAIMKRLGK